jgi:hypothetical protein
VEYLVVDIEFMFIADGTPWLNVLQANTGSVNSLLTWPEWKTKFCFKLQTLNDYTL